MKKIFATLLFLSCISIVSAKKIEVKFSACVDGDTAKFIYKDEKITARFLAIDTPETVHPTKEEEDFGKEASNYTCNKLKEAKKIVLEFDEESDKKDKYDRYLVWVFVDNKLLQSELVKKGLASVAYLYGDYKYTNELEELEQKAEEKKLGIWSINSNDEIIEDVETNKETKAENSKDKKDINFYIEKYKEYIILLGALVIVSLFNLKSKKKIKNKLKNKIKSGIKKRLK